MPFVLRRHQELVTIVAKNSAEDKMVTQSIPPAIVQPLRAVYDQLNWNDSFRVDTNDITGYDFGHHPEEEETGRAGDGEVPLNIVQV